MRLRLQSARRIDDRTHARARALTRFAAHNFFVVALRAEIFEHEKSNGGGQVAVVTVGVDGRHQIRQRHIARDCDFLQAFPKCVFKTDARLMAGDDNRAFDNGRLHWPSPSSMRWPSRWRSAFSPNVPASLRMDLGWPWATRVALARSLSCLRLACLRVFLKLRISAMPCLEGSSIRRYLNRDCGPRINRPVIGDASPPERQANL